MNAIAKRVELLARSIAAIVCAVLLIGCSDGNDSHTVLLRIKGDGSLLLNYVAIVSFDDGHVAQIACPSGASPRLRCTAEGLRIEGDTASFEVTAKARTRAFAHQNFARDELPLSDEIPVAELTLGNLAPFEHTDDYSTGFTESDGLETFLRLSRSEQTELGPAELVKFYIHDLRGQPQVYFQDTNKHTLHYFFARNVLGVPLTIAEFNESTYHGLERTAMAGTLVYYPLTETSNPTLGQPLRAPINLTFFPSDDLTPEQALVAHRLLEERLGFAALSGDLKRVVYQPAGAIQEQQLTSATDSFARHGALWLTQSQLYGDVTLQILNHGLAYGTLKRMTPAELADAVVSYTDILVLTELPNWLPVVGGTITEQLQTPLAHVNVAARGRGTPNIALLDASQDERISTMLGKLVRFEVVDGSFSITETTLDEAQEFWDNRQVDPVVPQYDDTVTGLPGFDDLRFEDWLSVGVKAANLAELARLLGSQAPYGFAVPFYYFDQFMATAQVNETLCVDAYADCVDEGRSEEICHAAKQLCSKLCSNPQGRLQTLWQYFYRLIADEQFKTNTELREAALDGLRYHIGHLPLDTEFAQLLDQRIAQVFGSSKVRIRSSTNTEDLPNFSGAGLYRSVSAYATGPDAASDRIRKVWASVFNWRAFEERSFWNIDHRSVRMGCAVNQAFSDEAANGVLITQNIASPVPGMYVNVQLGEVSVTNPENGALPEIFAIIPAPEGVQLLRQRFSSLSPDVPLLSDGEVTELYNAAYKIRTYFAIWYGQSPKSLALELEFKFNNPDRSMIIKQARPYSVLTYR